MRKLSALLRTTFVGGPLIVLPVLLVFLILGEILDLLVVVAEPIATVLGIKGLTRANAILVSISPLDLVSLFIGLAVRTRSGVAVGRWFEQRLLNQMPSYRLLQPLSRRFAGDESGPRFAPAVVDSPMDTRMLAFIVEEHDSGDTTVFIPAAPTPAIGTIHILPRERVRRLDASMAAVANCVSDFRTGAGALLTLSRGADSPNHMN